VWSTASGTKFLFPDGSLGQIADNKTQPTKVVAALIDGLLEQTKRSDAKQLFVLMQNGFLARSGAMPKPDKRKTHMKAYQLPKLAVGDVLLVGKFKNRKASLSEAVLLA
jgi:hypothetical protein